jgi:hypothetical protein
MGATLPSEAARVTFRMWRRGLNVSQRPIQLNFIASLLRNRRNVADRAAISRLASCAASGLGRAFHHAAARRKTGLLLDSLRHGSRPPRSARLSSWPPPDCDPGVSRPSTTHRFSDGSDVPSRQQRVRGTEISVLPSACGDSASNCVDGRDTPGSQSGGGYDNESCGLGFCRWIVSCLRAGVAAVCGPPNWISTHEAS